jgi:glycosyltransferase involved in cell wall biosynthesis
MTDKSIVFVINCLEIGGAEIQVTRLAQGMIRRGYRVAVVSMLKPGPLAEPLTAMGAEVHTLGMRAGVPNPLAILRLRRILRQFRPHIVHSHIVHANLLSRITRLVAPIPVLVCTAHNLCEGGRILELSYRYTDALADLTTNVSQAAVDRYISVGAAPANRIRFVPNGLDLRGFVPDAAMRAQLRNELGLGDAFVWLAVGRFREQKDYPNLLRAFATLDAQHASVANMLVIAGSGDREPEAKHLSVSLNVTSRVRFLGMRSDIPALMNMADAFVLSSAWEGMPLVLQEASASSLPIVATDVGGCREVAIDGVNAFLAPPQDPQALASAMRKLLALAPADHQRMGRAGRNQVVSNYDMEHVLDRWESIYAELTDGRATVPAMNSI